MRYNKSIITALFLVCFMIGIVTINSNKVRADEKPYYIKVNKTTNVVTVYKSNGTPYKAFVCSTGNATPLGTFNTSQKLRWHVLNGPTYGQYCTRITGSILFHSVWYYNNKDYDSQSTVQYNKLGTTASHGCVRLTVADAKWIYDNCPMGTKVIIFKGDSSKDPLGKPVALKVSTSSKRGWDPTDPNPDNPYLKKAPTITFKETSYTKGYNTSMDLRSVATARAAYGPYLDSVMSIYIKKPGSTTSAKLSGTTYTFTKIGTYVITYKVKDPKNGKVTSKALNVYCKDTGVPVINGVSTTTKTVEYKSSIELKKNITAKTGAGTNLTKYLKVKVTNPKGQSAWLSTSTYTFKQLGTYKFTYYVKNPNNNKATTKVAKYLVKDTKAPTISGVKSKWSLYKKAYNTMTGVTAKTATGVSLTSKMTVTVKDPSGSAVTLSSGKFTPTKLGLYTITYKVTGTNGKTTTKSMKVRSYYDGSPVIKGISTSDKTVNYKESVDIRTSAKIYTKKGTLLPKDDLTIEITRPDGSVSELASNVNNYSFNKAGRYVITYIAKNPANTVNMDVKSVTYYACYVPVIESTLQDYTYDITNGVSSVNVLENVKVYEKKTTSFNMKSKYLSYEVAYKGVNETDELESVEVVDDVFNLTKVGTYTISYTVSGTDVVTTHKVIAITVCDSTAIVYNDKNSSSYSAGDVISAKELVNVSLGNTSLLSYVDVTVVRMDGTNPIDVENSNGVFQADCAGNYVIYYKLNDNYKKFFTGAGSEYSKTIVVKA